MNTTTSPKMESLVYSQTLDDGQRNTGDQLRLESTLFYEQLKFLPAEPPTVQMTSRHQVALLSFFCSSVNTDGKEGKSPPEPPPQIILSTL